MQDDLMKRLWRAHDRIAALEAELKAKTALADDHFRNAKRLAGRCAALEADNARLMGLVKEAGEALDKLIEAADAMSWAANCGMADYQIKAASATLAKIKEMKHD